MKKSYKIMSTVCAAALATTITAGAASTLAEPSVNKVYVDGEQANVATCGINGNNYFKLRDLAAILSGTDAQFEVTWDRATGSITLTEGKAYTTVGGELGAIPAANQTAEDSTAVVYRDGVQVDYTGYNINNNNYYKLRDIAADFDFGVTWDRDTKSVLITTTEGYTPEGQEPETPVEPEEPVEPEQPDPPVAIDDDKVSPPVGEYSDYYQNYLDNCGEEIVTRTIKYTTSDQRTMERGTYGGFEAAVWTYPGVSYLNNGASPFDDSYPVLTIWVDESGSGTFDFKMPKSLYEKIMDGNDYFSIGCAEDKSNQVEIDGKMEYIAGGNVSYYIIRDNPSPLLIYIG